MRDIAARFEISDVGLGNADIPLNNPGHFGITKAVLGYATLASSRAFYNQALARLESVLGPLLKN
jgi:hypothetical protein